MLPVGVPEAARRPRPEPADRACIRVGVQADRRDKYRERGDAIFAGGVQRAWLDGAKQFNQNYMWSPDYIRWRGGAPSAGH